MYIQKSVIPCSVDWMTHRITKYKYRPTNDVFLFLAIFMSYMWRWSQASSPD